MAIGPSLTLSIFLTFQFIFGSANLILNEEGFGNQEIGSIVYPEFSDLRRKMYDEASPVPIILKTKNMTYYLEVELNEDLDDVPIVFEEEFWDDETRCHFQGRIISRPTGFVAISACSEDGQMTGVLMMEERIYFLSPNSNQDNKSLEKEHYLHEYLQENMEFCGITNERSLFFVEANINRAKRQTSNGRKVIEVAIFVDNELYNRIEATSVIDARQATVRRVLAIMNQVQLIYNYSSLLTKFKIVVMKLQILKSNQGAPSPENGDIDKYLDNFCIWQSEMNGRGGHWDHAIMLTGRDLYKETRGKRNPKVLGLAWVNGMCRTNYSCTLNEGTSFEAAFVIAHEIAHNLGVMHDGSGNNCDRNKYIMSDKTGPGKVHWSACSNIYIKNFLGSGNGRCLSDDGSPHNRSSNLTLPGMRYSLSDQCTLALGAGYSPHKSNEEPFNNVCRELWCASGSWAKPAHPALEGSQCAEGKLCLEGVCRKARSAVSAKTADSTRQFATPESGGILRKIQDTVMKAVRNLG